MFSLKHKTFHTGKHFKETLVFLILNTAVGPQTNFLRIKYEDFFFFEGTQLRFVLHGS